MEFELIYLILIFLGGIAGFLAGLLGIGGAIILVPMLMFIPPLVGTTFTFHAITGLSMAQVFFAALTGAVTHAKGGNLRWSLIVVIGGVMLVTSFAGSISAVYLPEQTLTLIFLIVLSVSMVMLARPQHIVNEPCKINEDGSECPVDYLKSTEDKVKGGFIGAGVGFLSGLVGIGGAAFIIPAMNILLKVPIKICIGTSLGIILAGGTAGFFGKAITGQVPFLEAAFLVVGTVVGARLGSKVSMGLSPELLRKLLVGVLFLVSIRILLTIIL